jgi:hypothetical protein
MYSKRVNWMETLRAFNPGGTIEWDLDRSARYSTLVGYPNVTAKYKFFNLCLYLLAREVPEIRERRCFRRHPCPKRKTDVQPASVSSLRHHDRQKVVFLCGRQHGAAAIFQEFPAINT